MFARLFRRSPLSDGIATGLYGAIVAQARDPAFYQLFGVADTVQGRFELVVLHTALVLRRLDRGDATAQAEGQAVFDLFRLDMDRSLRELGIGDLSVPKKMKKMTMAYYGRAGAYEDGLAGGPRPDFEAAIARNVFPGIDAPAGAPALAAYAAAAAARLAGLPVASVLSGEGLFPSPTAFASAGAEA